MPITNSHNSNSKCVFLPARSGSVTIMELPPHNPESAICTSENDPGRTQAWTNFPLFTVGMVQRGHIEEDIRKILGGNMLRVTRAALKGVHRMLPAGKKPSEIKEIP
jgi:hypothetical protein